MEIEKYRQQENHQSKISNLNRKSRENRGSDYDNRFN